MEKMNWQETSQVQTEQGLQISIKETQMVKSLIKSLLAYFELIVFLLFLKCLSRERFYFKSLLIYFRGVFNYKHI